MLKNRLIPVILLRNGVVVQSKGFRRYQVLGNPVSIVRRLSDWASDELIYLDISTESTYDLRRDDLRSAARFEILDILEDISRECFMPMAFGGGIRSLDDINARILRGADKVVINTQALMDPGFIDLAARAFGSQCIVLCIDAKCIGEGRWEVFSSCGRRGTGRAPVEWVREAVSRGVGEVLIQSIDNDGAGAGYDLPLIREITETVRVPVIALGGVGDWAHLGDGLRQGNADAVGAANIFNYTEQSVYHAKTYLYENGYNVRRPTLGYDTRA